jgi:DnaK suppressor protein
MTKQKTEAYRQQLLDMAERLDRDLSGVRDEAMRGTGGEAGGGLSNAPLHLADLGTDTFEQEVAADLMRNQQQVLIAIRQALDRIDAGTFGACERCGKEIPEGRLRALPYAMRCVECEAQAEKDGDADVGP